MAKTNLEIERGGFLYDQFNRKEIAFRELNSAELTSDRPEGGTRKDADGRELVVAAGLQSMLGVKNVKDPLFGAKGDGVTDDTTAIQEAITEAGTFGSVFLPKGEYLISKPLSISFNAFSLKGAGFRSSTLTLANSANSSFITTPDDGVQREGLLLKDIGFEGNAANQTGEAPAINIRGMDEARFEGLFIKKPRGNGVQIGQATGGILNTVPKFHNCLFRADKVNSQANGIALESGSSDAQVIGCDIGEFRNGAGILISGHAGYELIGNHCWQNLNGYKIFQGQRGRIIGCLADFSQNWGFIFQNLSEEVTQVIGCQSRGSGQAGVNTYDAFIVEGSEAGKACKAMIFSGCRGMGAKSRYGLNFAKNCKNIQVIGCDFTENEKEAIHEGAEAVEHISIVGASSRLDKGIGLFGKAAPTSQPAEIVPAAITVKELMEKLNTLHKEYGITA